MTEPMIAAGTVDSPAAGLLVAEELSVEYGRRQHRVRAVDRVNLTVRPGEVVGLVGESGCGKSSLGRALVGLEPAATGQVSFGGAPVVPLGQARRPERLRSLQMVFQDPYSSLNPRRRVGDLIADGVLLSRAGVRPSGGSRAGAARLGGGSRAAAARLGDEGRAAAARLAGELLDRVGLSADAVTKYPHEFSGGQRQRIAIARTLAARPSCIVADEPISALDASAQAQVANLLLSLAREDGLGIVFISHDLSIVRQIADRVAVMYLGRIVETGDTEPVWSKTVHPYTEALVSAIPRADGAGRLPVDLPGDVPNPARPPTGCRFHPRCPLAEPRCSGVDPELRPVPGQAGGPQHAAACLVRVPS